RRKLHVAVEPVLVLLYGMNGKFGVDHAELDDDADPQGYLIRGEDFLAFDGEIALAHIHEHELHQRTFLAEEALAPGDFVTAGFEDLGEHTIFIPESPVRILDDDLNFLHVSLTSSESDPGAGLIRSTTENRSASAESHSQ